MPFGFAATLLRRAISGFAVLCHGAPAALNKYMLLGIGKGTLWPIFMVLRFQMAEIIAKNPFEPKWAAYAFSYPYAFS